MASVFFSYSHLDEEYRDRLEVHLTPLIRQGLIETWHDRRVGAGDEILNEIDVNLEKAEIVLLLISPDFIASDYCYNVEMSRAIERHEAGEARVIPVILRPCDWQDMPFGKLLASPLDGKPVIKFSNIDDGFLEVAKAIRDAVQHIKPTPPHSSYDKHVSQNPNVIDTSRSSNLRIRKQFSDYDRDKFLTDAFEYITKYFENSLNELQQRNSEVNIEFRPIDANTFSSAIYINGDLATECKISIRGQGFASKGINYSAHRSSNNNSSNGSLTVSDDGYSLYLEPIGLSMMYNQQDSQNKLSHEGGAEYFWNVFVNPLQN